MTGTLYTGAYFNGIVLSDPATQKPATIGMTGYVGNIGTAPSHNGDAIYGQAGTAWSVINKGTIVSNTGNASSAGIHLKSGGTVSNQATGAIAGQLAGIFIEGAAGTVSNSGTIAGNAGHGIYLGGGGRVTNGKSGSPAALISGAFNGVVVTGGSGTVVNFGTIE